MPNLSRAILSVSDKTGIADLARALSAKGVEILSTGGTAKHLTDAGIAVTPIAQWSGAPEILGGRVKTLTPKVFGAILHDRGNVDHIADVHETGQPVLVGTRDVAESEELHERLVRRGVPFREAHGIVGGLVRAAVDRGKQLSELSEDELHELAPQLDGQFYELLDEGSWLESKVSDGGTAMSRVRDQLAQARQVLREARS